jgi:very-short-patch-repair endonuclease/DNA-binding XRE family transcriptional regulator
MKRITFNKKDTNKIISLYEKDLLTIQMIAKTVGVSRPTIRKTLVENDIRIRSQAEQMKIGYELGRKDGQALTKEAHKVTRKMIKEGTHPFCDPDIIKKGQSTNSKNKYNTKAERELIKLFKKLEINYCHTYYIKRKETKSNGRVQIPRYYIADFYLPDYNLIIECDGEYWHRDKKKDLERTEKILQLGYKDVIRFSNKDIFNNKRNILEKLYEIAV